MKYYDVAVVGGGLLGCFAARSLARYELSVVLIDEQEDVCRGISRANSAVIYTGYDNKPGSLKAEMTVRANAGFAKLCGELEIDFIRRGSLLLSYDESCDRVLQKKLENGVESGVPGLRLVSGEEALELEPMLGTVPRCALYAPGTGTVNPWQLGIAAFENAVMNGCTPMLETELRGIERAEGGYVLKTGRGELHCRAVINCAGLKADAVREMLFEPEIRLFYDASDFLVFDKHAPRPGVILFQEQPQGKGISLVPTVDGNLLLESEARELRGGHFAFDRDSRERLVKKAGSMVKGVAGENIIRAFAAVRPNPRYVKKAGEDYVPTGKDISSFVIDRPEPGFISLLGIKTPGLSCANELGLYAADKTAEYLKAEKRKGFDPRRPAIMQLRHMDLAQRAALVRAEPDYGEIVCLCEDISKAEVKQAMLRGARSVEGVKRRLGSAMGPCQGSRCSYAISKILEAGK